MPARITPPTKRLPSKALPKAFRHISVVYDYSLVKFRNRREGYKAERQTVDCDLVQVGTLNAQVRIHCFVYGRDEYSGKEETIDVDFYLPVGEFKKVSRLVRGVRFRRNRQGVLTPRKWR